MPYKSDKIIIDHTENDRRIKLNEYQKIEIRNLYKQGYSQRQLARMYNVSRRLIQFIVIDGLLEHNKELYKLRGGWKKYYNKNNHKEYIKDHRNYKHYLYKEGVISL